MFHSRTAGTTPAPVKSPSTDQLVTVRELDARLDGVRTELKWQRWVITVLAAAIALPKLGGPSALALATALAHNTHLF